MISMSSKAPVIWSARMRVSTAPPRPGAQSDRSSRSVPPSATAEATAGDTPKAPERNSPSVAVPAVSATISSVLPACSRSTAAPPSRPSNPATARLPSRLSTLPAPRSNDPPDVASSACPLSPTDSATCPLTAPVLAKRPPVTSISSRSASR